MKRRKTAKTQRPNSLKRRNAPKADHHRKALAADASERIALLTHERDEALEQQTAASEVLKVISSSQGKLEPVFQAVLANAVRLCAAKFGTLWLAEAEGDLFRSTAVHDLPPALAEARRREPVVKFAPNTGIGRVVRTKQAVHVDDMSRDPAYLVRNPRAVTLVELGGARTVMFAPMFKEDRVIGVLTIYRQEVRPFTEKQIELVQNFAAQAVIAIENARLLSELRQRTNDLSESLEQQTATSEVLRVISSSAGELESVFQTLLGNATRLCCADFGFMFHYKDGFFQLMAQRGADPAYVEYMQREPLRPGPETLLGRIAKSISPVQIADFASSQAYLDRDPLAVVAVERGGVRTLFGVPMLREGELIGAVALYRQEVSLFTEKQIDLLTNFAAQAVIAIENTRLLNDLRQRTHELAASLDNLRTTQDRLVQTQKLASLGQLTAGIAHEIKNPLNFVNNFSEISAELIDELQDTLKGPIDDKARGEIRELTDTLKGNLDKVVQHGKRADALVKNMLLHSREGSGEHRPVDINTIVEESLNLAYHGARAEKQGFNITLERSFDPAAGEADVFPQDITRALLNLISNGFYAATKRKAETSGGQYEPTLTAATKNLGDRVAISIRDNGIGIPRDVKQKMFNPFFTTKPAGEGTGLGLSISHDIVVKQHGGSIEVDTEAGNFTEIRIILPRAAALLPER